MHIAVINGVCRPRDAIGEVAHATYKIIQEQPGWACKLFTFENGFALDDPDIVQVQSLEHMLTNPFFGHADQYLFSFGIYSDLIRGLAAGRAGSRRIVRFHNVTPRHLVSPKSRKLIDKSLEQIALFDFAEALWADSSYNKRDLILSGIDACKIGVHPLYSVATTNSTEPIRKPAGRVEMLYLGRFVEAKGVLDLVDAVDQLRNRSTVPIRLTLAGALMFSDADYIAKIKQTIHNRNLSDVCNFIGELSEAELCAAYSNAHIISIPSYHEGFCVPILEGMQAGCIPVAYDTGNVPDLVGDFGMLVKAGDVAGLSQSLFILVSWFKHYWAGGNPSLPLATSMSLAAYQSHVRNHLQQFSFAAFRDRLLQHLRY